MGSPVLRQPESQPESRLLATVKRLLRPQPLGRAVELAFLRWEKRQLASTERFWRDFGMHIVESGPQRLLARGTGHRPASPWRRGAARTASWAGLRYVG